MCLTGDEEGPLFRALAAMIWTAGARCCAGCAASSATGIYSWRSSAISGASEDRILSGIGRAAREFGLPLLATNGVLYAEPAGQQVLDVMTCVRHHTIWMRRAGS